MLGEGCKSSVLQVHAQAEVDASTDISSIVHRKSCSAPGAFLREHCADLQRTAVQSKSRQAASCSSPYEVPYDPYERSKSHLRIVMSEYMNEACCASGKFQVSRSDAMLTFLYLQLSHENE